MPRAKPNPYAALHPIVALLSQLTHDELRDLSDMLETELAASGDPLPLRRGLPPVDSILSGGWRYRESPEMFTEPARWELETAYQNASLLKKEAQWLVIDFTRVLRDALAPIKERKQRDNLPTAQGNLEAKYIPRYVYDRDTGQMEKHIYGPYLYYRYWATGGDKDKRKRRQKNEYIGAQTLAVMFEKTTIGSTERRELEKQIIAAHKAGTLDDLMLELGLAPAESS